MTRRRHQLRDERGSLVAVVEIVQTLDSIATPQTVELAADIPGASIRCTVFHPAIAAIVATPRSRPRAVPQQGQLRLLA